MTLFFLFNPKFYQIGGAGSGGGGMGGSWSPSYDAWKITLPHIKKIHKETKKVQRKAKKVKAKLMEISATYGRDFPTGLLESLDTLHEVEKNFTTLASYAILEMEEILASPALLLEIAEIADINTPITPSNIITLLPLLKASPMVEEVNSLDELKNLLTEASEAERKRKVLYHILDEDLLIYCVLMDT